MIKRTGNLIITYIDINPKSDTYNTVKTEVVENSPICENWKPNMNIVEETDEYIEYVDVNEYSYTYGQGVTVDKNNLTSPALLVANRQCELQEYNEGVYGNTGYENVTLVDCNPNSPTYQELSEDRRVSSTCLKPNTNPIPSQVESCVETIYYPSGIRGNEGTKHVSLVDVNPYSPTYNEELSSYDIPYGCAVPDGKPHYVSICEYCKTNDFGKMTGWAIRVLKDINAFSVSYGSILNVEVENSDCND